VTNNTQSGSLRNNSNHQTYPHSPNDISTSANKELLNIYCLNAQSVKNKSLSISDLVITNDIDILLVTETWLGTDIDRAVISELTPKGYTFQHAPRPRQKRGGGIGILHKSALKISVQETSALSNFTHFELMDCLINLNNQSIRLSIIYRPPPSTQNGFKNSVFFQEWHNYMDQLASDPHELIIAGDVNIHLDNENHPDTRRFTDILTSCNLKQHINDPTHKSGHTLDVLITRDSTKLLCDPPFVHDPHLCDFHGHSAGDHLGICLKILYKKPSCITQKIRFRKYRTISTPVFLNDVLNASANIDLTQSSQQLVSTYNNLMQKIIDKHAPLITKTITLRPHAPWYDDTLREAKHERRKAERKWRHTHLVEDKRLYKDKCNRMNALLSNAKKVYYNKKITDAGKDQKQLYKITRSLLGDTNDVSLPTNNSELGLAENFGHFFENKIKTIRDNIILSGQTQSDVLAEDTVFNGECLDNFKPITEDELQTLILKAPNKSCGLDPLPTWLLKECIIPLAPLLTAIINNSLSEGEVPSELKHAIVRPLLKKQGLDKELLKNYRIKFVFYL